MRSSIFDSSGPNSNSNPVRFANNSTQVIFFTTKDFDVFTKSLSPCVLFNVVPGYI